jgi:hypothetical protein
MERQTDRHDSQYMNFYNSAVTMPKSINEKELSKTRKQFHTKNKLKNVRETKLKCEYAANLWPHIP